MFRQQLENAVKLAIRQSPFAPALRKIFRKNLLAEANDIGLNTGWDAAAQWLVSAAGRATLQDSRFHDVLRHGINTDIQTEFLLTALRRELLFADPGILEQPAITDTICTLVHQCLNNEYVWYVSEAEQKILSDKLKSVKNTNGQRRAWTDVAQLAMYARLGEILPQGDSMETAIGRIEAMPPCLHEFVASYLSKHEEEISLKTSIGSFGAIGRSASKLVAENYEHYPYPRWIGMDMPGPGERHRRLREFFDDNDLTFLQQPFNILVAGCGTGNKAIEYALSYGNLAQVLAVDLSRASLAYAARMARKYRASNIEFLQIDLLDLPELKRQFDIVECTGVLHHMQDPAEGGRALSDCVRDGGIMHISLYSELSRREIVRLRQGYEARMPDITSDDVRHYRRQWMQQDADLIDNRLPLRWDFFDLNRCKDLLFHPLEHRFTIPQIGRLLDDLGLEFRGLETPDLIPTQYWTPYPSPKDRRNLSRWHEFEQNNPDAFGNLYEIWSRKTGHH
jgi:SAM-dependent methyltransferase